MKCLIFLLLRVVVIRSLPYNKEAVNLSQEFSSCCSKKSEQLRKISKF